MGTPASPTARRFELSRRLRDLRLQAGKSVEEVAKELECSTAKVSRIEGGERVATALDVKVLSRFYGLSPRLQADLMSLATEARKRGWWYDYRSLDEQTRTYVGLESAAHRVCNLEIVIVPGLLQIPTYTAGLIETIIELRRKRQERVVSGDLQLHVVIDESALHRRLGKPPVMVDQVDHLIVASRWPNVTLQIVTFDAGSHQGLLGAFSVLSFHEQELRDLVFAEGLSGNSTLRAEERQDTVAEYRAAFDHLATQVALTPDESRVWLEAHRDRLAMRGGGGRSAGSHA